MGERFYNIIRATGALNLVPNDGTITDVHRQFFTTLFGQLINVGDDVLIAGSCNDHFVVKHISQIVGDEGSVTVTHYNDMSLRRLETDVLEYPDRIRNVLGTDQDAFTNDDKFNFMLIRMPSNNMDLPDYILDRIKGRGGAIVGNGFNLYQEVYERQFDGTFVRKKLNVDDYGVALQSVCPNRKLTWDMVHQFKFKAVPAPPLAVAEDGEVKIRLPECPVCLLPPAPPTTICVNGHSICANCREQVYSCPTCRENFAGRNFMLDDILQQVQFR